MIRSAALALVLTLPLVPSARAASVEIVVDGVEASPAKVYVALCQGGLSDTACRIGDDAPGGGGARRFVLPDVPPGVWAVAAYQDLNGNGRLDRTGLGLPLEPYAFSGGVGRRARPDFASAGFVLREPGTAIRLRLARALPAR